MNTKHKLAFALLLTMAAAGFLYAQSGAATTVQQSSQMLNVATKVADCNGAVNAACVATATPSGSNYVYITGMDITICGDATGTAQTNLSWVLAGVTGTPNIWQYSATTTNTAALCQTKVINPTTPIKSTTPGVAVTLTAPAVALHTAYNANVYWYEGQ
jgi:hypothetical protein